MRYVARAVLSALALAAGAGADTISFDDINVHGSFDTVAADRYASQGIVFSRGWVVYDFGAVDPAHRPGFLNAGATSPNMALLNGGFGTDIDLTFVVPGTMTAATTDHVAVLFIDLEPGTPLGTIQAFNAAGALIDMQTVISPASGGAVLQVNATGISRVHLSADADGVSVDNLDFDAPIVPMCMADFNQSGAVDSQDFFDFLAAFFAHLPSADFNHSGAVDSQDFFDFLTAFFAGC
jgi:hypothetical protein